MEYSLKYKLQKPDTRDFVYTGKLTTVSNNIELKMPIIYDQLQLGSCVSNAVALCVYYFLKINPSRLYIYFNGRAIGGHNLKQDTGLSVRDGCKSVAKYFITNETNWPYNINEFTTLPNFSSYNSAITFKNMVYNAVKQDINSIKSCLSAGLPILIGIAIYSSFLTQSVANTGIIPMPNTNIEKIQGYHCVTVIGYDDIKKVFKCANSWGKNWGDKGYFYLPYNYIININLAFDFWCINFLLNVPKVKNFTNNNLLLKKRSVLHHPKINHPKINHSTNKILLITIKK